MHKCKCISLPFSLSLSACEEKSKATANHVPHTRAYGMSNTGALRIHSYELNNGTDRLTESETDAVVVDENISVLNLYMASNTHWRVQSEHLLASG